MRRVHSSVMTPENTELIQKSIYTLILTMKNIEMRLARAALNAFPCNGISVSCFRAVIEPALPSFCPV